MGNNKKEEADEFAKWMELLFADPYYLDEACFRVDVFETESHYIIEADLPLYTSKQIKVKCQDNAMIIHVYEERGECKERTVCFPFTLLDKDVRAYFEKDILEIHISKEQTCHHQQNCKEIIINDED